MVGSIAKRPSPSDTRAVATTSSQTHAADDTASEIGGVRNPVQPAFHFGDRSAPSGQSRAAWRETFGTPSRSEPPDKRDSGLDPRAAPAAAAPPSPFAFRFLFLFLILF